MGPIHLILEQF